MQRAMSITIIAQRAYCERALRARNSSVHRIGPDQRPMPWANGGVVAGKGATGGRCGRSTNSESKKRQPRRLWRGRERVMLMRTRLIIPRVMSNLYSISDGPSLRRPLCVAGVISSIHINLRTELLRKAGAERARKLRARMPREEGRTDQSVSTTGVQAPHCAIVEAPRSLHRHWTIIQFQPSAPSG